MFPFSAAPLLVLLLPLTGDLSDVGLRVKQGAELAVEEARSRGVTMSLWVCDTAGQPEQASSWLSSLKAVQEGTVIVGPLTHAELRAMEAVTQTAVPLISPTAWSEKPGWWFTALSPYLEGQEISRWMVGRWKEPRIGLLWPADTYGREVVKGWLAEGRRSPVVSVTYAPGQVDYRQACLRMGGSDLEDVKKDFEADRRGVRLRMLRVTRKAFEEVKKEDALRVGMLPLGVEGTLVQQIELEREAVKGVRDAVVQERGGTLESIEIPKGESAETVAARWLEDPSRTAVVVPGVREFNLRMNPSWIEAATLVPLPFPVLRESPVLASIEMGLYRREGDPERLQTVMTLMPRRRQNALKLDAIYSPGDGGDAVQQMSQFRFYELGMTVIGSQRWHREELVKNVGRFPYEIVVPTVFYGESDEERVSEFVRRFTTHLVDLPDRYAALGYDAAQWGILLLRENRRGLSEASLEFDGVTGGVKVKGGRVVERHVKFLTVKKGQWMELGNP